MAKWNFEDYINLGVIINDFARSGDAVNDYLDSKVDLDNYTEMSHLWAYLTAFSTSIPQDVYRHLYVNTPYFADIHSFSAISRNKLHLSTESVIKAPPVYKVDEVKYLIENIPAPLNPQYYNSMSVLLAKRLKHILETGSENHDYGSFRSYNNDLEKLDYSGDKETIEKVFKIYSERDTFEYLINTPQFSLHAAVYLIRPDVETDALDRVIEQYGKTNSSIATIALCHENMSTSTLNQMYEHYNSFDNYDVIRSILLNPNVDEECVLSILADKDSDVKKRRMAALSPVVGFSDLMDVYQDESDDEMVRFNALFNENMPLMFQELHYTLGEL